MHAAPAAAAEVTVNTTADNTATGSECMGIAGDCSLRQALDKAKAAVTATTIDFNLPAGSEILTNGALEVENPSTAPLTIAGPGANALTVHNGGGADNFGVLRVFNSAVVSISGITLSGGNITHSSSGAGIDSFGSAELELFEMVVTGNTANGVENGAGGIRQEGAELLIVNSTIAGNSITASGGVGFNAGGIASFRPAILINTTVANNTVTGSASGPDGGGIVNDEGTFTIVNGTIAGNSATHGAGGVLIGGPTMLANTIIASNTGSSAPDCLRNNVGTSTSQGYNLIGNASGCNFTATTGDLIGTGASPINPLLGPLGDNGGLNPTMALLTGSPAIDAGNPAPESELLPPSPPTLIPCPTRDERGAPRPDLAGTPCDIGAFEFQQPPKTEPKTELKSPPPPAAGQAPPVIGKATQSHSRWREGSALAKFSRKRAPLGTIFSFTLNEQAAVSFTFTQHLGGRNVKSRCVAQTKANRRKHACKRTLPRGTLSFSGHAGTNKVTFQGRISPSKKLPPGTYTLTIEATNSAGTRSTPVSLSFTIVR